jgi:hypothetical protein
MIGSAALLEPCAETGRHVDEIQGLACTRAGGADREYYLKAARFEMVDLREVEDNVAGRV